MFCLLSPLSLSLSLCLVPPSSFLCLFKSVFQGFCLSVSLSCLPPSLLPWMRLRLGDAPTQTHIAGSLTMFESELEMRNCVWKCGIVSVHECAACHQLKCWC